MNQRRLVELELFWEMRPYNPYQVVILEAMMLSRIMQLVYGILETILMEENVALVESLLQVEV